MLARPLLSNLARSQARNTLWGGPMNNFKMQSQNRLKMILGLFLCIMFIGQTTSLHSILKSLPRLPASSDREPAKMESYKIEDGYGVYTGQGKTKLQASEGARTGCVLSKVAAYENKNGGITPDTDTVDYFIDACINK